MYKSDDCLQEKCFLTTIGKKVLSWRTIRNDSRLRILIGLTQLDNSIATYVIPHEDNDKLYWTEFLLYITRPKVLSLKSGYFHITVSANRKITYSAVAKLRMISTCGDGSPNVLHFTDVRPMGIPTIIPNPSSESFPCTEILHLSIDNIAEPCIPPHDCTDCKMISVGAWWHRRTKRLYYLRMDKAILAVCPEGWRARSIGTVLAKLLNHSEGCDMCSVSGLHADVYNAMWSTNGVCSTEFSESCACIAPCLWRKMNQQKIAVKGRQDLCQSLFVAPVSSVNILQDRDNPRITGRLEDLISSYSERKIVPVNASAWHLVHLSEAWSNVMIAGCARLSRIIEST